MQWRTATKVSEDSEQFERQTEFILVFKIGNFKETLIENFSMTKASLQRKHLAGRFVNSGDEPS